MPSAPARGASAPALSRPNTPARLGELRASFEEAGIDALLVTKRENVRYLTGFSGSAGMLLVAPTSALLATDGRYRDQASAQLEAAGVEAELFIGGYGPQFDALVRAASGLGRIGIEAQHASVALFEHLRSVFGNEPHGTRGLVERLRLRKDEGEVARIERACEIADDALSSVRRRLAERPSESEFAAELEYAMRRLGSSGASFETIVASGPNGALPHARPSDRRIEEGDLVVVDFGATVDGYHSDMTRTFSIGEPDDARRAQYEAVAESQRAGVDALGPGRLASEVDVACRTVLARLGFGEYFTHGTGHGVGLEIHEAPSVGSGAADSLAPGMIVTVEPGAYLPGTGGVRIEDTLVVTEDGARMLTSSTKDYLP